MATRAFVMGWNKICVKQRNADKPGERQVCQWEMRETWQQSLKRNIYTEDYVKYILFDRQQVIKRCRYEERERRRMGR